MSLVALAEGESPNCPDALGHVLETLRLAALLGARPSEPLVFPAPLLSLLSGRRMFFLRGWERCDSLVKGFNALGLLAEHASLERRRLEGLPADELRGVKAAFLASRGVFPEAELAGLDLSALALWTAFAGRTIVCATSANMGIALHRALLDLRRLEVSAGGKRFAVLKPDEGRLVIWCPDERADFMSPEKSAVLRALEAERPGLTTLVTYINRQERDPGALKQALACGGYFFPTNPQSRSELQNLLAIGLRELAAERGVAAAVLLADPAVRRALASLGAEVSQDRVLVRSAVEGGMLGMAAPYLIMLEEALQRDDAGAVSVWNPVSIGAALAAMALTDGLLRREPPELGIFFPRLDAFLRAGGFGRRLHARIHGVFDISNLQSLAQLFGVVVRRHFSGRQTAYVGLGSSSYASGNLCFEILERSAAAGGSFRGRDALHPAAHALNPMAQALVFAEDLHRAACAPGFGALSSDAKVSALQARCRKPEPAGAAALAGYLLARLDAGTLSHAELAFALRAGGFGKDLFLEFSGFGKDEGAGERYIQRCGEEGPCMEALARGVLEALERDWGSLSDAAAAERDRSRRAYRWSALDDDVFEAANPAVHIHLTGDNCAQPAPAFLAGLLDSYERTRAALASRLAADAAAQAEGPGFDALTAVKLASGAASRLLGRAQKGLDALVRGAVRPLLDRGAKR